VAGPTAHRTPGTTHRARRGAGIRYRMVLLLVVPLTGLGAMAGVAVAGQHDTALRASWISARLPAVARLAGLAAAIDSEHAASVSSALAAPRGAVTGEPSEEAVRQAGRGATDRALAALGGDAPFDAPVVRAARDATDRGTAGAAEVSARYAVLEHLARGALDAQITAIEPATVGLPGADHVLRDLQEVRAAADAHQLASQEIGELASLWRTPPAGRDAALVRLASSAAAYAEARGQLPAPGAGSTGEAPLAADAATGAFDHAIATAEPGAALVTLEVTAGGGWSQAAIVLADGVARDHQLAGLATAASGAARADAAALDAAATAAYHWWLLGAAVALGLIVVLSAVVGRSVAHPLRRLARRADALARGLDEERPGRRAPKEATEVAALIDGLVSTLRLIGSKAEALANGELGDPVLAEPLPGSFSTSLDASLRAVADSMVGRAELEQRLADQAVEDPLTGLPNRGATVDALRESLVRSRRSTDRTALLLIDLDRFEQVNETQGHNVGDRILRQLAGRLHQEVRSGDLVGHLGGDQFALIARRVGSVSEAIGMAHRMIAVLHQPVGGRSGHLCISASVGVVLAGDGGAEADAVLERAAMALDRAKQRGPSSVDLYDESLELQLIERQDTEQGLAATLRRGGDELVLHYQPVVDARSGRLSGVEALVRWQRPGFGLVSPDRFIPVAECSHLVIDLDDWVLNAAVGQLEQWAGVPGLDELTIAVNISGRHLLSQTLWDRLRTLMATRPFDPGKLTLEITETVLLRDLTAAASELERVRAAGVRIAIDDFGAGHTSLAHLRRLPVDIIKIDRSFVTQLDRLRDRSLVRMVTELGHDLGLTVVAEGVETDEQLAALRGIGPDRVQGFLISKPLAATELVAWVGAGTTTPAPVAG